MVSGTKNQRVNLLLLTTRRLFHQALFLDSIKQPPPPTARLSDAVISHCPLKHLAPYISPWNTHVPKESDSVDFW